MIAIIEFVLGLLILPYLLIGFFVADVAKFITELFDPWLLFIGVITAVIGLELQRHSTPDDSPFISIVDSIAQSHVFGIAVPTIFLCGAVILIGISAFRALPSRKST